MAKLHLKFKGALLKELLLTQDVITIGRLPDNVIQIDHLGVSGHHAKIYWNRDHYDVEDLGSLNGTYVNHQKVTRQSLKDGDVIYIGEHVLSFKDQGSQEKVGEAHAASSAAKPQEAVRRSDPAKEKIMNATPATPVAKAPATPIISQPAASGGEKVGVLKVVEGKTDQQQYLLTGKMSVIGKSEMASIKLKGWFAPQMAALISRREDAYMIAASEKDVKVMVNGEAIQGHTDLKEGDLIEVAGVKMTFAFAE